MSYIITEGQLRDVVGVAVNKYLLFEAKALSNLVYAIANKYGFDGEKSRQLSTLIMCDPTAKKTDRGDFVGRYANWIIDQFIKGSIKIGDRPELQQSLKVYDANKSTLGPITGYTDLDALITDMANYDESFKPSRNISKAKKGLEKVYEDDEWVVYIPHTYEAARRIGEGTHWCTASGNDAYYNRYTSAGPLYVNINKRTGDRYQFHFPSKQFMDVDDCKVSLSEIGLSEGLINFYEDICPWFLYRSEYESIEDLGTGVALVKDEEGNLNFLTKDGELLDDFGFDYVEKISNNYFRIKSDGQQNIADYYGNLITNIWYDDIEDFDQFGLAKVSLNGMENFICEDGYPLTNKWYDYCRGFNNAGVCLVEIDEHYNYINLNGEELSDINFDNLLEFKAGHSWGQLDDKWALITEEGRMTEKWFDDFSDDYKGHAVATSDGIKYVVNTTTGQFSPLQGQWKR